MRLWVAKMLIFGGLIVAVVAAFYTGTQLDGLLAVVAPIVSFPVLFVGASFLALYVVAPLEAGGVAFVNDTFRKFVPRMVLFVGGLVGVATVGYLLWGPRVPPGIFLLLMALSYVFEQRRKAHRRNNPE